MTAATTTKRAHHTWRSPSWPPVSARSRCFAGHPTYVLEHDSAVVIVLAAVAAVLIALPSRPVERDDCLHGQLAMLAGGTVVGYASE